MEPRPSDRSKPSSNRRRTGVAGWTRVWTGRMRPGRRVGCSPARGRPPTREDARRRAGPRNGRPSSPVSIRRHARDTRRGRGPRPAGRAGRTRPSAPSDSNTRPRRARRPDYADHARPWSSTPHTTIRSRSRPPICVPHRRPMAASESPRGGWFRRRACPRRGRAARRRRAARVHGSHSRTRIRCRLRCTDRCHVSRAYGSRLQSKAFRLDGCIG